MASKLRAQRVGVFVGRPVMVKQQKPPNVLLSHHLGAIELPPPLPIALSNQPSALSGQASGLSGQASSRLQEPDLQVAAREVLHLFRIVRKRPALPDLLHQNPGWCVCHGSEQHLACGWLSQVWCYPTSGQARN